jgi:hypothetical protein
LNNNQDPNIQECSDKITPEQIIEGYQPNIKNYCNVRNTEHCQTSKSYKEK